MKFALVAPPNALWLLEKFNLSYHLVLAQHFEDTEYRTWYQAAARRGDFIIVDNGAAEYGKSMEPLYLSAAAEELGASEIVMPDVLKNAHSTLSATLEAVDVIPEKNRMCVPQGESWEAWIYCLEQQVHIGCATIGVAKLYEGYSGGRLYALEEIRRRGYHLTHHVHLLGCYAAPVEEVTQVMNQYPWVRGIDTAAPIAYAQENLSVASTAHKSLTWDSSFSKSQAIDNVMTMLDVCN